MSASGDNPGYRAAMGRCFRSSVAFQGQPVETETAAIQFALLAEDVTEPPGLDNDNLPLLAMPEDASTTATDTGCLALVAVEGQDRRMAAAIAALLDPEVVSVGLMHVTWMPRTIASPLRAAGLDNPDPGELLIYQGAREALIDTAADLRAAGFDVSAHLRENRDPARPLIDTIRQQAPDLFVLGLGRHGAGIARRVLEEVRIPVLFVHAR